MKDTGPSLETDNHRRICQRTPGIPLKRHFSNLFLSTSESFTKFLDTCYLFLQKDYPIFFKNGTLKLGGEREPVPRPKKWPIANILAPGANNIPDAFIVGGPYEEEEGELNRPEVRELGGFGDNLSALTYDKTYVYSL